LTRKNIFQIIGPGILVAATGVGAGDLATAAFTGSKLGLSILWVVIFGSFLKFVLNEGLARWQLATGTTFLEGSLHHFGLTAQYTFLLYFLVWSFMVAAALMSACGVALHALFPIFTDPSQGKIYFGILQSLLGILIVRLGGYKLFEKIMRFCIGLMFLTVMVTAVVINPDWGQTFTGIFVPIVPLSSGEGLSWTIALMGGVGGTVTILCYGYWIREEGRTKVSDIKICRVDLVSGYIMTALFGLSMVIIGSTIKIEGKGALLVVRLAEQLAIHLGIIGKWAFLIGAWGAIFSSLLGVWQSVPYLFSDIIFRIKSNPTSLNQNLNTNSLLYRGYLYALAIIPIFGMWVGFANMQKLYAIVGALFMPILSITLLVLMGRAKWVGAEYKNKPLTNVVLMLILLFFLYAGWLMIIK
jgi:Mn2+/Fe2+ NRAMP family transporter